MKCKKCDHPLNFDQQKLGFCSESCAQTYDASRVHEEFKKPLQTITKYPQLKNLSSLFKMLAAFCCVLTLVVMVSLIVMFQSASVVLVFISLIGGVFAVLLNLAIAEGILLLIDIEDNTSKMANKNVVEQVEASDSAPSS